MPIIEKDPWREQYFADVPCPKSVIIPTDDELAWQLYPTHRWIYNKLLICESQGIACAPHDIPPPSFPVFSKPIYNLRGMGEGGCVVASAMEYQRAIDAGHMWMPLLSGEHVSSDCALVDGAPRWWRHTVGHGIGGGMFDYWTVQAQARPEIETYCGAWLRRHLHGYTGCVNLETIGGMIIEVHLRFADQWPDLYGAGWIAATVDLYANRRWVYADSDRRTGYSVVLFGPHGRPHPAFDPKLITHLRRRPDIASVQITFDPSRPPAAHAMPPGGFRLAVINSWDLEAGRAARAEIAALLLPDSIERLRSA